MKRLLSCFLLLSVLLMPVMVPAEEEDVSLFAKPTPVPSVESPQAEVENQEEIQQKSEEQVILQPDGSVMITISAGGDLTFGGDVRERRESLFDRELKRQGGDLSFVARNVREILEKDDMTLVNFETTLTTAPVYKKNNSFVFSAPLEYVEILEHFSIEAVSFENNHAMDHGETGIEETQRVLTQAGIVWSTEAHPAIYETKGVRIGMLAYQTFNGNYPRLTEKVPQDIAMMRQKSDIVIVSYHWGDELDYMPNSNQQDLGRLTIDSGADLVLGHHSHRINPIEQYNGKYIVYSLANFSFAGNNKPSDMSSFIFQTRFSFKDGQAAPQGFRIVPMRISSKTDYNDFIPTPYTDQRQIDTVINTMLSNSRKLPYAVTNYPLDWE